MKDKVYLAVDLKSFYASVECIERGLDPLATNLVVADAGRTEKTICLAVFPSLKAYGIPGRARLFEVVQKVAEVNALRRQRAPGRQFAGASSHDPEVRADPALALDYVVAPPRMAHYIDWSTRIYNVYLKYIAPEDICVYSIDEVLMNATNYLPTYKLSARELARKIVLDVLKTTGITATAGIGANLYLAKVAMDIWAKHTQPDENGVRVAELLIDHAWGWEPCGMADIKAYKPAAKSVGSGQVLTCPYSFEKARMVAWEMADQLALDLVGQRLATDQLTLTVGYDIENLRDPERAKSYKGSVSTDRYGRQIPKHAHGTVNLEGYTASSKQITAAILELFDRIVDKTLLVRRMYLTANHVTDEGTVPNGPVHGPGGRPCGAGG